MKTNSQNKFYTSVSKYYSDIFPFKPIQQKFVENGVRDLSGKCILDIGCATGELAFQLAKQGAIVTGIDLNADLLEQAKKGVGDFNSQEIRSRLKIETPNPTFQIGNMLEVKNDFQKEQFDAVLCFGNTLVHLPDLKAVKTMLEGVYAVLKPGGMFFLQLLNYDYIFDKNITELPLIENDKISFVRNYQLDHKNGLLRFQTRLKVKELNKTISNETTLLGLKSNELKTALAGTGFTQIQLFSSFKREKFGSAHLPLVASCLKEK